MAWASVAVGAVSLGASVYKGIKAKNQDNAAAKEGAALKRPFEKVQDEYFQDRNIAAEQATGGLSVDEKNYAQEQRDRGLSSSLEALKETGGGPNDFARVNGIFSDSLKSQSALDSQEHLKNIDFFTGVNKDLAGQKTTQFGVNELQPYESKLKEIQDRRIAAQTNQNNAVDEGIGSLSALATGLNSRNPSGRGKDTGSSLSPYTRRFGLADTKGPASSPAAGVSSINPNAPNIMNNAPADPLQTAPIIEGADDDWYNN